MSGKRGPNTTAGKAAASRNATTHAITSTLPIIPGLESAREWNQHRNRLLLSLAPSDAVQHALAERAAAILWRLRRVQRYELECIASWQERISSDRRLADAASALLGPKIGSASVAERIARSASLIRALFDVDTGEPIDPIDARAVVTLLGHQPGVAASIRATVDLRRFVMQEAEKRGVSPASLTTEMAGKVDAMAVEYDPSIRSDAARRDAMSRRRIIPDSDELDRVMRYEAHLSRLFFQCIHEIEARQARARGAAAPLARLELNGGNG